ncbi:MAG: hypothetical protein RJA81_576 [Planctomycetota bacterium]|jgi:hypothetical protein
MELTFECSQCNAVNRVPDAQNCTQFKCQFCQAVREAKPHSITEEGLVHCPYCGTEKLYIQKDFPQGLGLTIVIAGFAWATYHWYMIQPIAAYSVLLGSALVDLILWKKVPDVVICYRCLSQMRGSDTKPLGRFLPFNLEVGETFRQERIRAAEIRQKQSTSG